MVATKYLKLDISILNFKDLELKELSTLLDSKLMLLSVHQLKRKKNHWAPTQDEVTLALKV